MSRPQTIQIYLPAGDPRGMRVAEITTRIVRVIEVPRSQLADFLKMPEAQQVGVYFLMGELSEAGLPRAYIGQSGNVGTLAAQSGLLVFTRDHVFASPSMAAMAVMGRSANGWIEWKAANGKTLDEVKRQVVGAEALDV
jgi:hypothetical protein